MIRKKTRRLSGARVALLLASAAFLVLAGTRFGYAQTKSGATLGLDRETFMGTVQGSWNIEAGSLSYDHNNEVYTAEGAVRITSLDRRIEADWASVDMKKKQAELRGNVLIRYGKNWMKGDHVVWNLDRETGWLDGGIVYFAENQFYAQGQSISKIGPTQYELKQGFLTGCDPQNPDWKIKYDDMKVNVEGLAMATGTSFWAREVPLLYSPFLVIPVEQKRQSGFLVPWLAYSDITGMDGEVPFYWAIRQDMDLTLYSRYMEERGWMGGAEFRIAHKDLGEGIWAFNYLDDQAGKKFLAQHGYPYQTSDRYWVRGRHNFELPFEIEGRINLDYVSDRNFLDEFSRGSASYDIADRVFRDTMGRGLIDDETSLTRESTVYLEKRGESSVVSLDNRYFEQLDENLEDYTTQRLPALSFRVAPSWIDRLPVYYTLESSMVNFWRKEGDTGQRMDVYPRVYYPLSWKNYIDFEPSIGLRGMGYSTDWSKDVFDQWQGRVLGDVQVDLSTRLNRVYPVNFGNFTALEHSIRPEIKYAYLADGFDGDFPRFDLLDDDQTRHALRYGFSTFLTAKELRKDAEGNSAVSYRELARMELYQLFNFEQPPVRDAFLEFGEEQGFTSVGMRIDVMPLRHLMLSYDANLYSDAEYGYHQDLLLTLDSGRGHAIRFDYQYRGDTSINELTTEVLVKALPSLYLTTYHDYSIDEEQLYKQGYGFRYFKGCWSVGVSYEREAGDNRVLVSLNLLGLGNIAGGMGAKPFGASSPFASFPPLGMP